MNIDRRKKMDEKIKVLSVNLELDTGIVQKSDNFVGTTEHEDKLVDDMKDKVEDNLYLTRAFKSKEKGIQCFVVSEPIGDCNNDYKVNCSIEVKIVLKDDMLKGKEKLLKIDDINELIGEAGLKEQIIEETNAFIDELNRRSEGKSFTVLDVNEDGYLPDWDYNNGKYLVAVDNDWEYRDHPPMHWKDESVHIDHITEETLGMYYDSYYENSLTVEYLLKESEKDKMQAKNKKDIGVDLS